MDCPKCGAVVNPQLVTGGVARCQWCDHIWEAAGAQVAAASAAPVADVADPIAPPVESAPAPTNVVRPRSRRRLLDSCPPGVRVSETDDGVLVSIPWRQQAGLVVHLFFIAIGAVVVGAVLNGESLLGEGLFAIAFLVVYAYMLVNATELSIGPKGVEVHHGPLPSPMDPNVSVSAANLGFLEVRAEEMSYRTRYGGRNTVTHYTLRAGQTVLLRKFASEEVVDFVAELIAWHVETPVEIRHSAE